MAGEDALMDPVDILIWLVIGAVAGWLAGQLISGGGFGLIGDIVVGIVGSLIAGYLLPLIGIHIGAGFIRAVVRTALGGPRGGAAIVARRG